MTTSHATALTAEPPIYTDRTRNQVRGEVPGLVKAAAPDQARDAVATREKEQPVRLSTGTAAAAVVREIRPLSVIHQYKVV